MPDRSDWIKPLAPRTLADIDRELSEARALVAKLQAERDNLLLDERLTAIAQARTLMRAHDISLADLAEAAPTGSPNSSEVRGQRSGELGRPTLAKRKRVLKGAMARLDPVTAGILEAAGLSSLEDVVRALDDGSIGTVNRLGPVRRAQVADWIAKERSAAMQTLPS
ncbi:hypothetical protein AACH06_25595 [Ideonella sp. DXS29W]|uniref:DUF4332 domain-containing protein n=1 Tax=Ideonella lacteola TaxID=2984193 RepID=A0ABU9BZD5_9BURK